MAYVEKKESTCPRCDGGGKDPKDKDCELCDGKGKLIHLNVGDNEVIVKDSAKFVG